MEDQRPLHTEDAADGTIPGQGPGLALDHGPGGGEGLHGPGPDLAPVLAGAILGLDLVAAVARDHIRGHVLEARVAPAPQMNVNQNRPRNRIRKMEWMRQQPWKTNSNWSALIRAPSHARDLAHVQSRDLGQSHAASLGPGHAQGLWSEDWLSKESSGHSGQAALEMLIPLNSCPDICSTGMLGRYLFISVLTVYWIPVILS